MGLWDKLFGEFVDVIEWTDDSSNTMVYRFERYGNEIKYGAKLTVRESQIAVFVNEGQVADVLGPGIYQLETNNLPLLTTLQHWDHGFKSPFKAEVYFCNTRRFTDLKWGTKNPLMLRDIEFGAVRLRAFGTYSCRVSDPTRFIREITGTDGVFTIEEISDQLRNLITSRFATVLAGAEIPILDLAANYDQLGDYLTTRIAPEFGEYGLELTKMLVENISLPPEVEQALDKRTSMGMIGNLDRYLKYQTAEAMEDAANNSAGGAGEGLGMGLGFAMANRLGEASASDSSGAPRDTLPPPLPTLRSFHVELDGEAVGPLPIDEVREKIADGDIKPTTLVWSSGMHDWQAAGTVVALSGAFESRKSAGAAVPPPLPGKPD
ncbi:SPFH domain-containing protein [Granulosicoccaceae sp. 1_MG-2023]|nr:SPFH domain-containing protein [Granulosicoccaceae sp. 1_MG-2023]